ncbi:hypothetical protein [Paraglaciecola chathamensis]|uniref:hypothetical protein n=1 Tax=Paraglaciecola chathamensis TaxID=368405 RepID=UPI00363F7268
MATFNDILPDLKKYDRKVKRAVYDNIVEGTNDAMRSYNPKPSAYSEGFYSRFKYRGKIGGAFHEHSQAGVYVKVKSGGHIIGANVNSAQAAILDATSFKLRSRTQRNKGLLTHGARKQQTFNWEAAEKKVNKARERTQSVIDGVKQ